MNLDQLIALVADLPDDQKYWFVRTEGGEYFDTFLEENFIGIDWDKISASDLNKPQHELKAKIAKTENIDTDSKSGPSRVTAIYTKLQRFKDLQKGDIVVIPSKGSNMLAFGQIIDNKIYSENNVVKLSECPFRKRRKARWFKSERLTRLSDGFYKIKQSRHAISNITKYSEYIDPELDSLFTKGEKVHLVLDVQRTEYIDFEQLTEFMTELKNLSKLIDDNFGLTDQVPISIRLELQSPGKIEFIRSAGKGLIILAILLASCFEGEYQKTKVKEIDDFATEHIDTLRKLDTYMDSLDIAKDKLFRP